MTDAQQTMADLEGMKTVRTFPHVISSALHECFTAAAIIQHCTKEIRKIDEEIAGQSSIYLSILEHLSGSLIDQAEVLEAVLHEK